jgi:hypothetical protein
MQFERLKHGLADFGGRGRIQYDESLRHRDQSMPTSALMYCRRS